jgi:uncharacterized protein
MHLRSWASALALAAMLCGALPAAEPQAPVPILDQMKLRDAATLRQGVPVDLRDGTRLNATLIMPNRPSGERLPTILIQSPYDPSPSPRLCAPAMRSRSSTFAAPNGPKANITG